MNPNFLLAHRNMYLERTDDGQNTPREYTKFNSYIKNLQVLVFQSDGWTDRRTDGQRHLSGGGLGNLSIPPHHLPVLICGFFGEKKTSSTRKTSTKKTTEQVPEMPLQTHHDKPSSIISGSSIAMMEIFPSSKNALMLWKPKLPRAS